jgi:RimJ/RimL family protein N-acetyltransferase
MHNQSQVMATSQERRRHMITIRHVKESDADPLLALYKQLDHETQFMMLEPGERRTTVEEQRQRIRDLLARENQTIFVVEHGEQLIGYLAAIGGQFCRNSHSAYLVTGILQGFTGQGIGQRLFAELEQWARRQGLHRLELTVMAHNERAIALYTRMGFEIEGIKKHSLIVNGEYVDEYYMARLLS